MKKELLCPVGSMDAMHAAVHNGADAIYLAGKSFGARAFAQNFTDEELVYVIKYAHLYDVKVYITVNTLIKDVEFEDAIKFIDFLHINGVDAIILQDIGLASIVSKMFPNLELHASTQMHNLDNFTCKLLKKLGFKRVVLARELSIDEIKKINTDLEIEVFIHGALCMSYSGQCLLSSMAMNRSGNRGACSQLCRMPYTLLVDSKEYNKDGKYLLSPKDLKTKDIFNELLLSNISSLKIEGRMKSPEYVATVTRMYRKLIDGDENISKEEKDLDQLFNRGYSLGHLKDNINLMNIKRGNHKGIKIGEVIDINENFITIKLTDKLYVGDGIKFDKSDKGLSAFNIYKNREIIKEGNPGDIITIPNKINLKVKDVVLKTVDVRLNNELKKYDEKKIDIDIKVIAKVNNKLKIVITDGINTFEEDGELVEKATNKEVTYDDILDKVTKLGNTPFIDDDVEIDKDENIFIRLSDINNIRRNLVEKLISIRENKNTNYLKVENEIKFDTYNDDLELSIFIRNERMLNIVKKYPYKRLYTDNYELYKNNRDLNIYYEVKINDDINFENDKLLVSSTSDIIKYNNNDLVLNYNLNVFNSNTLNYLNNYGIPTYSPEFTLDEYKNINRKVISLGEALIYGKVKVMTMNHCLLFDKAICDKCSFKNVRRELQDSFERRYTITCNNGINYLYDYKNVLKIKDLEELKFYGIKKFRIDFLDGKDETISKD